MLLEHLSAVVVVFNLPFDRKPGAFKAKIETLRYQKTVSPLLAWCRLLVIFTGIRYNPCMSNAYTYRVPFTEEQLHRDYAVLRMSQSEIAVKYKTTQKVVWRAMIKMGIKARVAAKRDQIGAKNSSWKGGKVLVAKNKRQRGERSSFGNGYFYVLMPGHPNSNKAGYVAEHILVATRERGRPLTIGECVHHIDLNKHNNEHKNLVIADRKTHAIWHVQLEEIAASFMKEGIVKFDPSRGYFRT